MAQSKHVYNLIHRAEVLCTRLDDIERIGAVSPPRTIALVDDEDWLQLGEVIGEAAKSLLAECQQRATAEFIKIVAEWAAYGIELSPDDSEDD